MKKLFTLMLLFLSSSSFAYCDNKGNLEKDECSNFELITNSIKNGNLIENYMDYLPSPYFLNSMESSKEGYKGKKPEQIEFMNAAMPIANKYPDLAFYVGSIIRSGNWHTSYVNDIDAAFSKKQIEYFEIAATSKSLEIRDEANKILGNIYYYGLLNPYITSIGSSHPKINIDYQKAAKYYSRCIPDSKYKSVQGCTRNYIASVLQFDVNKGLSLLHELKGYSEKDWRDGGPGWEIIYDQNEMADFKYRFLWVINKFGMFGLEIDNQAANEYYSIISNGDSVGLLEYTFKPGEDFSAKTGEDFFKMSEQFDKDVFSMGDSTKYSSFPENSEVEIYLLNRSLAKKYHKAARVLHFKYRNGDGVRKDYLKAYAYLNLAMGYVSENSNDTFDFDKDDYASWMKSFAFEFGLTKSQIIYAQQLSNDIENELINKYESKDRQPTTRSGTGFYISKDGYVVTNQHVIDGCIDIKLKQRDKIVSAKLIVEDVRNDIALLRTDSSQYTAYLRDGRGIRQGDEVIVFGYPLSGILSSSAKVTTGMVNSLSGLGDDYRYMQISAPVQPGNSGGPLFDIGGNIVGVVSSKLNAAEIQKSTGDIPQNINFALKSSIVKDLLDANNIDYETKKVGKSINTADLVEEAARFTVQIQCSK